MQGREVISERTNMQLYANVKDSSTEIKLRSWSVVTGILTSQSFCLRKFMRVCCPRRAEYESNFSFTPSRWSVSLFLVLLLVDTEKIRIKLVNSTKNEEQTGSIPDSFKIFNFSRSESACSHFFARNLWHSFLCSLSLYLKDWYVEKFIFFQK